MVPYFLFIVLIQPFFFSYNRLREAVSLNHWWSLIFQYFSEFSVLKTFYLNLMQGSFWFICSALPLLLCTTLGSEIKLFLFGSGSKEKCPCFETRDPVSVGKAVLFLPLLSLCYTSPHLLYCFLSYWSLSQLVQVQHHWKRWVPIEPGVCVLFPPVCNKATDLWCYQIIVFQKLLMKAWVTRQETKDFIFLNNTWQPQFVPIIWCLCSRAISWAQDLILQECRKMVTWFHVLKKSKWLKTFQVS